MKSKKLKFLNFEMVELFELLNPVTFPNACNFEVLKDFTCFESELFKILNTVTVLIS